MITVGSLFSGIGGLDLGLERAGMVIKWQVEIDPFCQKVLEKHWPHVKRYGDIKLLDDLELEPVDLICGGFPCQPVSVAGKRKGVNDERWLWPEFARLLRVVRPRYVLIENVPGLLRLGMAEVLRDLAEIGYDAEWEIISASAFGAPHHRKRVFIVAYSQGIRNRCLSNQQGDSWFQQDRCRWTGMGNEPCDSSKDVAYAPCEQDSRIQQPGVQPDSLASPFPHSQSLNGSWSVSRGGIFSPGERAPRRRLGSLGGTVWDTEPDLGRMVTRSPAKVDRLRGLGNAVVPQVAEWLGRQIMAFDELVGK